MLARTFPQVAPDLCVRGSSPSTNVDFGHGGRTQEPALQRIPKWLVGEETSSSPTPNGRNQFENGITADCGKVGRGDPEPALSGAQRSRMGGRPAPQRGRSRPAGAAGGHKVLPYHDRRGATVW